MGNNVDRWYEHQTGRYTSVDPLGFGGGSPYHYYARSNPLRFADPQGLKIVSIDPGLQSYIDCALAQGPPEFQEAYRYFDDPWWTAWKIRMRSGEEMRAMDQVPRVPRGSRSGSEPGQFGSNRITPGEFQIEPVPEGESACEHYVRAIMHEMLERHYKEVNNTPTLAGQHVGAPHTFAGTYDSPGKVCPNCCPLP